MFYNEVDAIKSSLRLVKWNSLSSKNLMIKIGPIIKWNSFGLCHLKFSEDVLFYIGPILCSVVIFLIDAQKPQMSMIDF